MSRVNRTPGASSAELPGYTASRSDPKPAYRFGVQLPAALADTREQPRWVTWDYVRKGNHWTKLPINPHTGRAASVSDPNTWATFDQALAAMRRHDLAGVGLVLTEEDKIAGIDLDDCISEEGTLSALAAAVVGYGETYVEVSPSGKGIRLFALGKIEKAVKDDANGIEIYGTGRYLTVTGQQLPGTPDRIAEASRTLDRLTAVAEATRAAKKALSTCNGIAQTHGSDFFRSVNEAALARLDEWVPRALPSAVKHGNGAWRVTSNDLRRDYQEDLSIHPTGIADFGPEKGLTPIDVMIEYAGCADPAAAAMWLCQRMRINPATLGWKQPTRGSGHTHTNSTESTEWPDPTDLPQSMRSVEPFDCDMLPEKMRPWAEDVSQRMQCPPDYVGVTIMVALGGLIGRKVAVRPKRADDWSVVSNLWGLCIGPPGIMKSPSQSEGLRPLKKLIAAARDAFNLAKAEYDLKVASVKARAKNAEKLAAKRLKENEKADVGDLLKLEKIKEPTQKRYITTNATYEALAVLMQQNLNGLLVDRDEMLSLLDRLDEEGHADERGFYLTGWNGDSSYTVDRIGRGLDLHVDAVCLSMIGGTQPARMSRYLTQVRRGGRGNDGLIQRFGLMVYPDIPRTWTNIDREPVREALDDALEAFQRLDTLDWRTLGAKRDVGPTGEEGIPYLRLSEKAHDLFLEWRTELERHLRQGLLDPMLEGHLAKYRKLIPALALIIHLTDGGTGDLSDAAMGKALKWAKYLETHAARVYGSTTIAAADAARAIVAKINSGHLKNQFGSREILRAQWSMLRDRETINAALRLLVDHDWLGVRKVETSGRTATFYIVNPKAFSNAATGR